MSNELGETHIVKDGAEALLHQKMLLMTKDLEENQSMKDHVNEISRTAAVLEQMHKSAMTARKPNTESDQGMLQLPFLFVLNC